MTTTNTTADGNRLAGMSALNSDEIKRAVTLLSSISDYLRRRADEADTHCTRQEFLEEASTGEAADLRRRAVAIETLVDGVTSGQVRLRGPCGNGCPWPTCLSIAGECTFGCDEDTRS